MKSWALKIFLSVMLLGGCDSFPDDPNGSLKNAKLNVLRVGAIPSPPWIIIEDNQVSGTDAHLIKGFADSIGAEVEWVTGSESELLLILEQYELHLVAGGQTTNTPWKKRVGLTNPYRNEKVVICSTDDTVLPNKIEESPIGVKKGSSIIAEVKKNEGVPVVRDSLAGYQGLVAVYESDMKRVGCGSERLTLITYDLVMAVPKGENGLLMALEEYLNARGY